MSIFSRFFTKKNTSATTTIKSLVYTGIINDTKLFQIASCKPNIDDLAAIDKTLVDRKEAVSIRNEIGQTLLHVVFSSGCNSHALAQLLIDHGADVNAVDDKGNIPLDYCIFDQQIDFLKSRGAKERDANWTSLPQDTIEVDNYGAYGNGSPLVVCRCPDLNHLGEIFDQPNLHPPQRITSYSTKKYWMKETSGNIRYTTVMAYLGHNDPHVRIATLAYAKKYHTFGVANQLIHLLVDPLPEVREAVAKCIWEIGCETAEGQEFIKTELFLILEEISAKKRDSFVDSTEAKHGLALLRKRMPPEARNWTSIEVKPEFLATMIRQSVNDHLNKMEQVVGQSQIDGKSVVNGDLQHARSRIEEIVRSAVGKFEQTFSDGKGHSIGISSPGKGNIMVSCWPCDIQELRPNFEERVGYSYEQQFPHYMEETRRNGCRFFLHLFLCRGVSQLSVTSCYCDTHMEALIRPTELVDC